jgi:hypothetical protein
MNPTDNTFPLPGQRSLNVTVNPDVDDAIYQVTLTVGIIKDFGTASSELKVSVNLGQGIVPCII